MIDNQELYKKATGILNQDLDQRVALSQMAEQVKEERKRHFTEDLGSDSLQAEHELRGQELNQVIDYAYKNNISIEPEAPFIEDMKYDKVYEATHDLAHMDSHEQKIIDMYKLKGIEKEESRLVDVDEIHARAKEAGVELQFREPITEGKLNFYINKELQKKELQQQLARYSEDPSDYTLKQNVLLGWAGISGAVGFWETAAYAALGFIDGPLIAGTLGLSARAFGTATSFTRGVKAAQIGINATKLANIGRNVALNAQRASNMLNVAKEGDALTKLGYDMYRFGRFQQGTPAGFLSSIAPFSVDGALTEIPMAVMKQVENVNEGGAFSTRDILKDALYASAFATSVPVLGKTLRATGYGIGAITKNITDSIAAKANKIASEAEVKGYQAVVDAADKDSKTISGNIAKVMDIVSEDRVSDKTLASIAQDMSQNISETEMPFYMALLLNGIQKGDISIFDKITFRTQWMTALSGMYDIVTRVAHESGNFVDFFSALKANKFGVLKTASKSKLLQSIKLANEEGALGRKFLTALNEDDAQRLLYNVYKYMISDDENIRITAKEEIQQHINHLSTVKQKVNDILNTYSKMFEANTRAKEAAAKGEEVNKYYSAVEQRFEYNIPGRTEKGTLYQALYNLALDFMPRTERDMFEAQVLDSAAIKDFVESFINKISKEDVTAQGKTFRNLTPLEEGLRQESMLETFIKDIDESLGDLSEVMKLEEVFEKEAGDTEEFINAIKNGESLDTFKYEIQEPIEGSNQDIRSLLNDKSNSIGRLENTRGNLAELKDSKGLKILSDAAEEAKHQKGTKSILARGYLLDVTDKIDKFEKVLTANWGKIRAAIIDNIYANKDIQAAIPEGVDFARVKNALVEQRETVKDIIRKSICEVAGIDDLPISVSEFKEELTETANKLIDNMIDEMKGTFKVTQQFDFEAALPKAEEVVESIDAIASTEKRMQDLDELLKPLMSDIGYAVADAQNIELQSFTHLIQDMDRIAKTPGQAPELILGMVTDTFIPTRETALSIEHLSDMKSNWLDFQKTLSKHTSSNSRENLMSWAFDKKNFNDIKKAIAVEIQVQDIADINMRNSLRSGISQDASKVAQLYLDACGKMQKALYDVGSGKTSLVSKYNHTKLRMAPNYYGGNSLDGAWNKGMRDILANSKKLNDKMRVQLSRWFDYVTKNTKEDNRIANLAFHWLEVFDLEKTLSPGYKHKLLLNDLRDALTGAKSFDALFKQYTPETIEKSLKAITEGFLDSSDKYGLLNRYQSGTSRALSTENTSTYCKYMDDVKQNMFYKSPEYEIADMTWFGHDSMKDWFEQDIGGARKAYAVLSRSSAEPYQYYMGLRDIVRSYVAGPLYKEMKGKSLENWKMLRDAIDSDTWESRLRYAVQEVCGINEVPAKAYLRAIKVAQRILSSPMLMLAGIKGLADYANQATDLISMGFMQAGDIGARARLYGRMITTLTDKAAGKDLRGALFLNNLGKTGMMESKMFQTGSSDILNDIGTEALDANFTRLMKWEMGSKKWSNFLLDKCGWVGPITEYNRSNAAISIMNAIGEMSEEIFDPKNAGALFAKRAKASLGRYGINQYEWENIYSKKCITTVNDYINKIGTKGSFGGMGSQKMFIADLLDDLTEEEVGTYLQAQGKRVTPENIRRYKNHLIDKGSLLINASADEMTSIPSERILGMLSLGTRPNSGQNVALNILTQFQSYGAAVTFYHHTRRLASFLDPEDPLWNRVLYNAITPGTATSLGGAITEAAISSYIIKRAVGVITGSNKKYEDEAGTTNWGTVGVDVGQEVLGQAGVYTSALEGMANAISLGRGSGGGLSIPIAPAVSNLLGLAGQTVVAPLARKGTEGHKLEAIAGGAIDLAGRLTGMKRQVMTAAPWSMTIGQLVDQWTYGTDYYKQKRKKEQRIEDSGIQKLVDYFTNR